jgi:hypothetical protein
MHQDRTSIPIRFNLPGMHTYAKADKTLSLSGIHDEALTQHDHEKHAIWIRWENEDESLLRVAMQLLGGRHYYPKRERRSPKNR